MRRSGGGGKCPDVNVQFHHKVPYTQDRFLTNDSNKTQLISLIASKLKDDGQNVTICNGDADTKIVSTALQLAQTKNNVPIVIVADDTDIAMMLLSLEEGIRRTYLLSTKIEQMMEDQRML